MSYSEGKTTDAMNKEKYTEGNPFENSPSKKTKEEQSVEAQKLGFTSLEERNIYLLVKERAFLLLHLSSYPRDMITKYEKEITEKELTKEEQLKLFQELGLTDFLNQALTMNKEDLQKSQFEFRTQCLEALKKKSGNANRELDEEIERYNKNHK